MNYGKLTAGTTKTAIDTAKPSEKGEIITYLSRMGDVLEQVAKRGKIVVPFVAVHAVIDGNIPNIAFSKETLGIIAHFQIVTTHAGHILDNDGSNLSCFGQPDHLIPARTVKRHPGHTIVNEERWIRETVVGCVLQKNFLLIGYAVALAVQRILLGQAGV